MYELYLLFIVITLPAFVRADYTIDDSDYSVLKFSENPAGPVWGPFGSDTGETLEIRLPNGTTQTIDATPCYDGTYTYAACTASDNCAVQFSFTGSGITIYVLQAGPQGTSASLSIDSGTGTTATLDAPSAPQYYTPRVVLFDVQNIPSGTHTAVMTVQDWNGGFSGMMLDYVDVNQAVVASASSSTSSSTSSPTLSSTPDTVSTQSSSSTSSASVYPQSTTPQQQTQPSPTGAVTNSGTPSVASFISVFSSQSSGTIAIVSSTPSGNATSSSYSTSKGTSHAVVVGGAVGGAVCLLALLGLALFCFRRRSRSQTVDETPGPFLSPQPGARFTNTNTASTGPLGSSAALTPSRPSELLHPLPSWTNLEVGSAPNRELDPIRRSPSLVPNVSHANGVSSSNSSATSPMSSSAGSATVPGPRVTGEPASYPDEKSQPSPTSGSTTPAQDPVSSTSPDMPSPGLNTVLTDEQVDFVHGLFNNNVPAPVVARVLERMTTNPLRASSVCVGDPGLRMRVDAGSLSTSSWTQGHRQPLAGGVSAWLPTLSDIGDYEDGAPPSYDDSREL